MTPTSAVSTTGSMEKRPAIWQIGHTGFSSLTQTHKWYCSWAEQTTQRSRPWLHLWCKRTIDRTPQSRVRIGDCHWSATSNIRNRTALLLPEARKRMSVSVRKCPARYYRTFRPPLLRFSGLSGELLLRWHTYDTRRIYPDGTGLV